MPKVQLTPEEKKELKAAKKAEKKRLAEEKKIQLQHDCLSREVKYGKLTVKLHEKNWKKMLKSIALPRMKEDLKFAWYNFERVIDSKDFIISLLMDEIKDAEEQYMMNLRGHAENIDRLVLMFRDRLDELKLDSENEIMKMQNQSEQKQEQIRVSFFDNEDYLKTMVYGLAMELKEQEKVVRGEYLSKLDEENTKYHDVIQNLRANLERTFGNLWSNTKNFLKDFITDTAARRKAYAVLAEQDAAVTHRCAYQLVKLEQMKENIKKLRTSFQMLQETQELKISDLLQERQYFADAFWTLKMRLEADKGLDYSNLALVTEESNDVTKYLKDVLQKGKFLLSLSAICRKFETEAEKVLPFPNRDVIDDNGEIVKDDEIKLTEYKNTANLKLFWQRVAQADGTRYGINEEREYLKRENKYLKSKIHNYCLCVDCPTYHIPKSESKPCGKVNVVDGNLMLKNYQKD